MIFTIQTYLEEYFKRCGYSDSDGYIVCLANTYFHNRSILSDELFFNKLHKINTVFFSNNKLKDRYQFEKNIITRLDRRFKKKEVFNGVFPGGVAHEQAKYCNLTRLSLGLILDDFCSAVEARAIDAIWISRKNGTLHQNPEKIGQGLFALYVQGTLRNRPGILLKEFQSGVGFVDFGIVLSSVLHLIELKVLTDRFTGVNQLEQYMKTENRRKGSLLVFDTLLPNRKENIPPRINLACGEIKVHVIDINPPSPSSLN